MKGKKDIEDELKQSEKPEPGNYLDAEGKEIFYKLLKGCESYMHLKEIDGILLSMLANSLSVFSKYARYCNKYGYTQKPEKGGWDQVRPEYTLMKDMMKMVLRMTPMFALSPGDRLKLGLEIQREEEDSELDLD